MDRIGSDIILQLIAWVDRNELKALRLLDKSFNDTTESTFWANHFIGLVGDWDRIHLKLEDIKNNLSSAQKIQSLRIKMPAMDMEGIAEVCQKVEEVLPEALPKLQALRSVVWIDPGWAIETIIQSLSSLPLLTKFTVDQGAWLEEPFPNLPLSYFHHGMLETLSICADFKDKDAYLSSLSMVLAHNPRISHLHLCMSVQFVSTPPSLTELFRRQSISQPLPLESLTLTGWRVELSSQVIPHLRSLRSLEINRPSRSIEFLDVAELPCPGFWKTLQTENIYLRRITVLIPHAHLFDYLDEFSGLEALKFLEAGSLMWEESERLAQRFYQAVLPKHPLLKELSILSHGPDMWSISEWNLEVFNGCTELRLLEVGVCEDDIYATSDPEKHIVAALVKRLAALPNFQTLTLEPVFNGRETGGMTFIADGIGQVDRILESMKLKPEEATSLIQICHGRRPGIYVPEIVEGEVIFKYLYKNRMYNSTSLIKWGS